jgi:hypothetical protein
MTFHKRKIVSVAAVVCMVFAFATAAIAETLTAGTYKELREHLKSVNPDGSRYADTQDKDVLIELTADIDVIQMGSELGFVTDEDTGATLTISRPNVTVDGKGKTITSRGYPAFHVEGSRDGDPVKGIVIQNVTVDGAGYQLKMGGGMFFENKAEVTLKNSVIKNGSAKLGGGGAFYAGPHGSAFGPEITVEDCTFDSNSTEAGAGGAILGFYAKLNISNSTFNGNRAPLGGAIALYGDGARLTVTGESKFTHNRATNSGGAVHVFYASHRAASRGTPVVTTSDIDADIDASFSGNAAKAVPSTADAVFGVAYDPATYTGDISENPASKLKVNGKSVPATVFADAERTRLLNPSKFIGVSTYQQLQGALGYAKFIGPSFDLVPDSDHPNPTYGPAADGDIIYLTGDLTSVSTNPDAQTTDDITGATIYINKNVALFGNGHKIDGRNFPVFDVEGTAADETEVKVSVSNLKIENGGYSRKLGGAVFVEGNSLLSVYNSSFANNTAARTGDAINGGGGAIYLNPHGGGTPKVNVVNSAFTGNKAPMGTGGAILAINGEISVSDSTFERNQASAGGALGAMGTGKFSVGSGNVFTANKAENAGGAIDLHYGRSSAGRGATNSKIETTFTGVSTFEGNQATLGDNVSYSRYYDADFPDDGSAPSIAYVEAGNPPAALDPATVTDLTFADIDRTKIADGDAGGDEKKTSGGGGCNSGFGLLVVAGLSFAAWRGRKGHK